MFPRISWTLISLNFLSGCLTGDAAITAKTYFFDPRVPSGLIGDVSATKLASVQGLTSNPTTTNISLAWEVPSIYSTMAYKIKVYRKECDLIDTTCKIPDPSAPYTLAGVYKVQDSKTSSYSEDGYFVQGEKITFWIYINYNGKWSAAASKTVTIPSSSGSSTITDFSTFWTKLKWVFGVDAVSYPGAPALYTLSSLKTATTTSFTLNTTTNEIDGTGPEGGAVLAPDGNTLYVVDTENNRVVVYVKKMALTCKSLYSNNADSLSACMIQANIMPFETQNVIGQPSQYTNFSCQDINSGADLSPYSGWTKTVVSGGSSVVSTDKSKALARCLTKPTRVYIDGSRLLIADSGNDRVVVWDHLPSNYGCDTGVISGQTTPEDCDPKFVIGKKGVSDVTKYIDPRNADASKRTYIQNTCSGSTKACGFYTLSHPADMLTIGNSLIVSDSKNHRLVVIDNYANTSLDKYAGGCNKLLTGAAVDSNDWSGALWDNCEFSRVLGQKTLGAAESINDLIDSVGVENVFDYSVGSENSLKTDYSGYLLRHFAYPQRMRVYTDSSGNKTLLVLSYDDLQRVSPVVGSTGGNFNLTLKARILAFNAKSLTSSTSGELCSTATFDFGGPCDATRVLGQISQDVVYAIPKDQAVGRGNYGGIYDLKDFALMGGTILGIDVEMSRVLVWNSWETSVQPGAIYDTYVENPKGALTDTGTSLPNLKGLSSIEYNPTYGSIYIIDSKSGKIYQVSVRD